MIRKYKAEDLEDLLLAWEKASKVAHPFLSDEFQELERHKIENVYLPVTETWVWAADRRVVGFISLMGDEIGGLFLDPQFQREGIGRALVDHVRELREQLEVEVFKENIIGRAFYKKYGFVLIQEKIHDETGFDIMRLRLAESNRLP